MVLMQTGGAPARRNVLTKSLFSPDLNGQHDNNKKERNPVEPGSLSSAALAQAALEYAARRWRHNRDDMDLIPRPGNGKAQGRSPVRRPRLARFSVVPACLGLA
jgi:hypothetical protein